jgi:deoxyribose-phosphate aldolase
VAQRTVDRDRICTSTRFPLVDELRNYKVYEAQANPFIRPGAAEFVPVVQNNKGIDVHGV